MKIKIYLLSVMSILLMNAFAQTSNHETLRSLVSTNRIPVVKATINLPESHGTTFWSIYEQYMKKHEETFQCNYLALNSLATSKEAMNDEESVACVNELLQYHYQEVAIKKQFFDEITNRTNGLVALQFLQMEELLDLIQQSELYEQNSAGQTLRRLRTVVTETSEKEKPEVLASILSLVDKDEKEFRLLFNEYEFENARVLGEDLTFFRICIDGISTLTPAQAKQMGEDFLVMQRNEIKLREKYFIEMDRVVGPHVAARFIALEKYLSIMQKMEAYSQSSLVSHENNSIVGE